MTIEMVFLDIGGVLYDDTVYARAWHRALRDAGARFTDAEFDEEYTRARTEQSGSFRRRLVARFLPDGDLRELESLAARYWHYPPSALYDDVRPVPRGAAGCGTGSASSPTSRGRSAPRCDVTVSSRSSRSGGSPTSSASGSPIPRSSSSSVKAAGVAPGASVMVGDRLDYDMRPATQVGMRTVWMLRGEAPDEPTRGSARGDRRGDREPRRPAGGAGTALVGMSTTASSRHILVVGAGFAGLYAAMGLKDAAAAGHRVTVVNEESFFQYQPFLPEVASGTIDPRAAVVPLRRVLKHCRIVIGEVTRVDHAAREAHRADGGR